MGLFRSERKQQAPMKWKITRTCLSFIFESAKSIYPREFAGLLRVDDVRKDTIIELVLLPGTVSGDHHAIFQLHMRPFDLSLVGTVHSHPSYSDRASDADVSLFRKYGRVHLIVAYPFEDGTWQSYDGEGNMISIDVV
jgi:proteasome lid subunit RPN8/RPN11